MSPLFDCLCPIFLQREGSLSQEQIGSAIVLSIATHKFILTAAHVLDQSKDGSLNVPTVDGIEPIVGKVAWLDLVGDSRSNDNLDIAYIKLADDLASRLHTKLQPLVRSNLSLFEFLDEGDFYTFAGYPWRKTETVAGGFATSLTSYTGKALSDSKLRKLDLRPDTHVAINFQLKKAFSMTTGQKRVAPMPHGVSGGGVFSWQKDLIDNVRAPELKCVAIAHTYNSNQHVLVGTRLQPYLALIASNHPEVFKEEWKAYFPNPAMIGVVWYRRSEWQELMRDFSDADNMPETWSAWRHKAEETIEKFALSGSLAVPIELSQSEIQKFCQLQGIPNNGYARSELANAKLAERVMGISVDLSKPFTRPQ